MTHQVEATLSTELLQLLIDPEAGNSRFSAALRLLFNEAMKLERAAALGAQPYERTDARTGYANGFKPKTLVTRVGPLELEVPQVRGGLDFYAA